VFACSYVFWLGDLNFRMDQLSAQEVKSRIAVGDVESLWIYDQVITLWCTLWWVDYIV